MNRVRSSLRDASAPLSVKPFWQALPGIIAYPLQPAALYMLGLLALLRLLDPLIGFITNYMIFSTLVIAFVHFVISMALYRYAVQALLDTSEGRLNAPEYSIGIEDHQAADQLRLQVLLVLASLLISFFAGWKIGLLTALAIALITPAATISLFMQRSLLLALSPFTWFEAMRGLGIRYLALAALCLVYALVQLAALAVLPLTLPRWLAVPLFWFVCHYTIVASFHAMGYVLLLYQSERGYVAKPDVRLPGNRHQLDSDHEVQAEAEAVAKQDSAAAIKLLAAHIDRNGGTRGTHQRYRDLLMQVGDQQTLTAHTRRYIDVLMAQGAEADAVRLFEAHLTAEPDYCPSQPEDVRPLATAAAKLGRNAQALQLIRTSMLRFPKHSELTGNALLGARVLAEKHGDTAAARALLLEIPERQHSHPDYSAVQAYLDFLQGRKSQA